MTGVGAAGFEPEPRFPPSIGRYKVARRIGAGGMGVVYEAYDPELDRKVAIKLVRSGASPALESTARLVREAQAMARLTHEHVMPVFDVGRHGNEVFVAMPFIEGETLAQWERRRPRSWRAIIDRYVAAGRGLSAAHDAGLVHRDFKAANVMLAADGRVLVMDFGLVTELTEGEAGATVAEQGRDEDPGRSVDHLWDGLTHSGQVMGTPSYMAPEQQTGQGAGASSDQFSFCASLAEALLGEPPFAGLSPAELIAAKMRGELVPFPPQSEVPRGVRDAVVRGLRPHPEDRWPSMRALTQRLDASRRGRLARWLWTGGLVLLGAAAVGGWWGQGRDVSAVGCSGDETLVSWTATKRREIRVALEASDQRYGAQTARHVLDGLDRHALQWAEAKQAACGELSRQDAPLADRAHQCLAQRRRRFDALVDVLAASEHAALEGAPRAVAGLPDVTRCLDEAWLASELPPPPSADVEVAADALRNHAVTGWALADIGSFEEARVLLEQTLHHAQELGYEPVVAEVEWMLGSALGAGDDLDAARDMLERAYFRGKQIGHHRVMLDAAGSIAYFHGLEGSDPQAAWTWVRHAESALRDVGGDPIERARLDLVIGNLYLLEGQHAQAEYAVKAALQVMEDAGPSVILDTSRALQNLGVVLEATGRFAEAVRYQRRALEIAEQITGRHHPLWTHAANNLANALHRAGHVDEALTWHERALQARREIFGEPHPDVANSLSNLGVLQLESGDAEQAVVTLGDAVKMWRALGQPEHRSAGVALLNHASALGKAGRPDDALAELTEAEGILQRTVPPDHPYWIYLLKERAAALAARDELTRARALLRDAVQRCDQLPNHGTGVCVEARVALAETLGDTDAEAVQALVRAAEDEYQRLDMQDHELRRRLDAVSR